jgi:hypothetical protein
MADPELVQALEYILNKSSDSSLEVIAQAVVRRRRELSLAGSSNLPDPVRLAKEISGQINAGVGASVESLKRSVRDMAAAIIGEHAPELNDDQVEELLNAWVPGRAPQAGPDSDIMLSMVEQFVSFSQGSMSRELDRSLREAAGEWPKRYWGLFPPAVRSIVTDYLKDNISREEFNSKIKIAVEVGRS